MIYVYDNAGNYSAHSLYFIEVGDDIPESVVLGIMRDSCDASGFIVLRTRKVEWRRGNASPLAEFLTPEKLVENISSEDALAGRAFPWRVLADVVPAKLVYQAFADWTKAVPAYGDHRQWYIARLKQIAKRFGIKWRVAR